MPAMPTEELDPLAPGAPEILVSVVLLVHVALVVLVLVLLRRGRVSLQPNMVLPAIVVVLFLPVLGPLLVLSATPRRRSDP